VEALLWEHFRLTRQNARFRAGEVRGADRAYSHVVYNVYNGGWTYQGSTLSIPLVIPAPATPGLRWEQRDRVLTGVVGSFARVMKKANLDSTRQRGAGPFPRRGGWLSDMHQRRAPSLRARPAHERDRGAFLRVGVVGRLLAQGAGRFRGPVRAEGLAGWTGRFLGSGPACAASFGDLPGVDGRMGVGVARCLWAVCQIVFACGGCRASRQCAT
jgi:hypothetical protein